MIRETKKEPTERSSGQTDKRRRTDKRWHIDKRRQRYTASFVLLVLGLVLFFLCNICIGSVSIPVSEIVKLAAGRTSDSMVKGIIWDIRLPRALAAMILGGALALAGYLLQTFFRNPIAGPFVLGISSGAKLAVALVMVFLMGRSVRISSLMLILAAFAGAMVSMCFVLVMSGKVNHMSMIVIGGIMIGYICSAVTDFVVTFADDADIVNLHNWSKGSFSGISWSNVAVMSVVVAIAFVLIFLLAKPISAYELGESYARSIGTDVRRLRIWLVILSSVLSACIVAFAGPVSFVGVAAPHLVKRLLGSTRPILMIPACFLGGSAFCLACDLIARTCFAPAELSISTVTAIFGAPVVLWVMMKRRREA